MGQGYIGSMNDAERYQRDFERLMREAEAKAEQLQTRERNTVWSGVERSFNHLAEVQHWSAEQREADSPVRSTARTATWFGLTVTTSIFSISWCTAPESLAS